MRVLPARLRLDLLLPEKLSRSVDRCLEYRLQSGLEPKRKTQLKLVL